jgi:Mce-associated membrane protein
MSATTSPAGRAVRPSWLRSGLLRGGTALGAVRSPSRGLAAPRTVRLRPRTLWALVALTVAAAAALGGTRGREAYAEHQREQARAEAVAAARQLAVNFVTVDYQRVGQDTDRVRAGATGDFLKSYSGSIAELKKVIVANKTVSRAERTEAALVSGDLDSAVALVGVVAPTTNTSVPDGQKKTYRMRLELRKVSDAWKVENLEFVG